MVCGPTPSAAVEKLAWPAASSGPDPSAAVPSMKVTVPVGVPVEPAAWVTIAARLTDWPTVDVSGEAATTVVVTAWLAARIVWTMVPLLAVKWSSPE